MEIRCIYHPVFFWRNQQKCPSSPFSLVACFIMKHYRKVKVFLFIASTSFSPTEGGRQCKNQIVFSRPCRRLSQIFSVILRISSLVSPWGWKAHSELMLNRPSSLSYCLLWTASTACAGCSRQSIKKQKHHFGDKGPYNQSYGFSSSYGKWELNHKEGWVLKNWCLWTMVLEKTLESPLDCQEIKPVNPKGSQSWVFIGKTDAEAETPIFWPPHMLSSY